MSVGSKKPNRFTKNYIIYGKERNIMENTKNAKDLCFTTKNLSLIHI